MSKKLPRKEKSNSLKKKKQKVIVIGLENLKKEFKKDIEEEELI